jgi:ABC-type sugar transport system ATPase subunit
LALKPDIFLFDEPMSALDAATRLLLRDEIKKIQKNFQSTMIYITHDQEEAFAMSDRIMVMNQGLIEQLDTPENIVRSPANQYVNDFVIRNLRLKIDSLTKYIGAGV